MSVSLETRLKVELERSNANVQSLSQKLAVATSLLQERDELHRARQQTMMDRCAAAEQETVALQRRIALLDAKERARAAEGQSFQRDVQDLERAAKMLTEREQDIEAKAEDIDRFTKRMHRQVVSLEAEVKRRKEEFTEKVREFDSYKETQKKRYTSLQEELESAVSQREHEHVKSKVEKLQREINVNMVSVENVGKLNAQLDMVRRQLKDDYVHRSDYEKVQNENELLKEAAKIVEETQKQTADEVRLAKKALPAMKERVERLEKELVNSRALVKDLSEIEARQRASLEDDRVEISQLTHKLTLLETSKASLLTQLGTLKITAKKGVEESGAHLTMSRKAESRAQELHSDNVRLDLELREARSRMSFLEERHTEMERECTHFAEEVKEKTRVQEHMVEENRVLSQSVLDLTSRTEMLESIAKAKQMAGDAAVEGPVAALARRYKEAGSPKTKNVGFAATTDAPHVVGSVASPEHLRKSKETVRLSEFKAELRREQVQDEVRTANAD